MLLRRRRQPEFLRNPSRRSRRKNPMILPYGCPKKNGANRCVRALVEAVGAKKWRALIRISKVRRRTLVNVFSCVLYQYTYYSSHNATRLAVYRKKSVLFFLSCGHDRRIFVGETNGKEKTKQKPQTRRKKDGRRWSAHKKKNYAKKDVIT